MYYTGPAVGNVVGNKHRWKLFLVLYWATAARDKPPHFATEANTRPEKKRHKDYKSGKKLAPSHSSLNPDQIFIY